LSSENSRIKTPTFLEQTEGNMAGGRKREPLEFQILRLIHPSHSAAAELFDDAVVRDGPADERLELRHLALILSSSLRQVNEQGKLATRASL
jgi:hypothetical protein